MRSEYRVHARLQRGVELGRWVALADPPAGRQTPASILDVALGADPALLEPAQLEQPIHPQWVAISYPEEGPRRGEQRRGFTFVELARPAGTRAAHRIAATQALTPGERALRLPELRGLEGARFILIGVASLGSRVAIELAKAGAGRIVLCDHDTFDVNNAVRHELPVNAAGQLKANAMAAACRAANPFCEVGAQGDWRPAVRI